MGAGPLWELDPAETGPLGSGIPEEQDTCESKIPRTMEHTWEQGPGEWDTWEQDPREWDS